MVNPEESSDDEDPYDADFFDKMYHSNGLRHKQPARMKYNSVTGRYWICFVNGIQFTKAQELNDQNMKDYDPILIQAARKRPNEWVGCSIADPRWVGDPCNDNAPESLKTKQRTIYQQHNQKFCLTFSLASALCYCGYNMEAEVLASQAPVFAKYSREEFLRRLLDLMVNLVPLIGRPTIFNKKRIQRKTERARDLKAEFLPGTCCFPNSCHTLPSLSQPGRTSRHPMLSVL